MKVTLKLLEEWGATCSGADWFDKHYPDGVEITAENVRKCPSAYYNKLWLLQQVAERAEDESAQVAVDMLAELAEPQDASWLANVVVKCPALDRGNAMDRLEAIGELEALTTVFEKAEETFALRAAKQIIATLPKEALDSYEQRLSLDRRDILVDARKEVSRGI